MDKLMKSIQRIIITIGIILLVVIILRNAFGLRLGFVPTNSMSPTIKEKTFIIVKEFKTEKEKNNIKEGDIAFFKMFIEEYEEEIYIIHRIIKIDNGVYKTKGDNNDYIDSWELKLNDIEGKIIKPKCK